MNELEKSALPQNPLPHRIFWLAYLLSFIGTGGLVALFWESGKVTEPSWLFATITLGFFIGPSIPNFYKEMKRFPHQSLPIAVKSVAFAFILMGFYTWVRVVLEYFDRDNFLLDIGNLSWCIVATKIGTGLLQGKPRWWVWGIRIASLYLALLIFNTVTDYQDYFSQIEVGVELIFHITATTMILLVLLAPKSRNVYDTQRSLNPPSTFSSASNSL